MRVLLRWSNARLLGRNFGEKLSTGVGPRRSSLHRGKRSFTLMRVTGKSMERKGELDHFTDQDDVHCATKTSTKKKSDFAKA